MYREEMNTPNQVMIGIELNEASRETVHKVKAKMKVKAKFFSKMAPSPGGLITNIHVPDRAYRPRVDETVPVTS